MHSINLQEVVREVDLTIFKHYTAGAGFIEIFLDAPIEVVLQRNKSRTKEQQVAGYIQFNL